MNVRNYAAIDCGTNSTRMLIANKSETLDRQMKITSSVTKAMDQIREAKSIISSVRIQILFLTLPITFIT